jgi:hypothetical protein
LTATGDWLWLFFVAFDLIAILVHVDDLDLLFVLLAQAWSVLLLLQLIVSGQCGAKEAESLVGNLFCEGQRVKGIGLAVLSRQGHSHWSAIECQAMELLDGVGCIRSTSEEHLSDSQWAALAVVFHLNLLHLSNTSAELSDVSCGDIVIELSDGNLCAAHGARALARGGSQSVKDRHWSRGWRLCLHWQRDHNWARCPHWRRCSERFPGDEDWLLGSLSRRRPRGGLAGLLEGSCRWLKRRLSLEFRILLLRMVHLCTLGFIFACDDFIERQIQTIHRRERAARTA